MAKRTSRLLLAVSAVILLAGGLMHARAFDRTVAAVAASNLVPFYGSSLKALWLIDSATLITLAAVFALIAFRPRLATGPVVALLALIPGATAAFLYVFLGAFLPAHLLFAAALLAVAAGIALGTGGPSAARAT